MARAVTTCDNCGQTDDHPKHHYGAETYHHDCTPHRVIEDMTSISVFDRLDDGSTVLLSRTPMDEADYPEHVKRFFKLRKLAQDGTKGDKLLAKALAYKPHDEISPLAKKQEG